MLLALVKLPCYLHHTSYHDTMTKMKVATVAASMLPRPKQIESSDLKFGSCVDELVPALRAEIKKANGDSDKIIEWQQKEIKRYSGEEKVP